MPISPRCVAAAAMAVCLTTFPFAPAEAAQTIVGRWRLPGHACTPFAGAMVIGPMSMTADDFRCDFSDVGRTGDVVRWKGVCGFPEPATRAAVTASLQGEMLVVRINDGGGNVYLRCR